MAEPSTGTVAGASVVPASTAAGRASGLLVMPLRAAEQHVLVVVGEADLHTAAKLRRQLIDALGTGPPSVVVELGALEFCDLAGLDALHDAARAAHDAGVALTFRGMSAQLSWLHQSFPPRSPVPPPSLPGPSQPVPAMTTAASRSAPTTAPAAPRDATTPRTPATSRTPGTPAVTAPARVGCPSAAQRPAPPADLTDARRGAVARRSAGTPIVYLTASGAGRRGAADGLVHAVPTSDTTHSAVCGARTRPATTSWTGTAPGSCQDCAASVATSFASSTIHPFPGSRTPAGIHPRPQGQPLARQVS